MITWQKMDSCPEDTFVLMTNGSVTTVARREDGRYCVMGAGGYECDYDFDIEPPSYWAPMPTPPADATLKSEEAVEAERKAARERHGPPPATVDPAMLDDFVRYLGPSTVLTKFNSGGDHE